MGEHDTVRPATLGQLKDLISTMVNAIPTKHLTFEMANRILGNKRFFIERINSVFEQLSRSFNADCHRLGDFWITQLYKNSADGEKVREEMTVREAKCLLRDQAIWSLGICISKKDFDRFCEGFKFLSFEFPMAAFIEDGNLYFFTKGEIFKQIHPYDDNLVSEKHRFITLGGFGQNRQ
ncbi:TPA: hypothetical protein DCZ46_03180 [Candidatus Campbellbacteria bacterium]|nr:MAG: hypothetical protein UR58_C0001G0609 [Candidatus Campbellbacteria bacterium GW2011_OD1_34_28]KKP74867.1 MAG: hypothetical protein UR74_C0002G0133 [Candidatus Campbellbacteria bacterium GW2011_GWD2_35_24]KKP75753.1 MAG: hypothetical protein UR75_C0002G0134 [Candidatus Campbellbacteria bacterium GW2011_GWC2_35_28]KKP76999.1 MAG: hypothetical protein UR76_C0002G0200 [Candidatus Campbellbacteria bacterium GW2011_GWC1_35_31]KKP78925.1 MAG: hypothetical protein UR79_C0002G0200 [Candidatus Cam